MTATDDLGQLDGFTLSPSIHPFAFAFAFATATATATAIVHCRSRRPFSVGPVARLFAVDFAVAISRSRGLAVAIARPLPRIRRRLHLSRPSSHPLSQLPSSSHLTSPGLHSRLSPPPAVAWPSSWPLLAPPPRFQVRLFRFHARCRRCKSLPVLSSPLFLQLSLLPFFRRIRCRLFASASALISFLFGGSLGPRLLALSGWIAPFHFLASFLG